MKITNHLPCIRHRERSFTLIELIMAIVVLAIVMIPLGAISIENMRGVVYSQKLAVAEALAKTEMAKINNLSYTDTTLEDGDDDTTANYEGFAYDLRRTVNFVPGWSSNLKEVRVRVYPTGTSEQLVELITYIANVSFGAGSAGGGGGGGGDEADSLSVTGGNINNRRLRRVTLENTSADTITITGVTISFSGGGIQLERIIINGAQRWNGSESSGSTITLDTSFVMAPETIYPQTARFIFSGRLNSVSSLVFIMGDATETPAYSW